MTIQEALTKGFSVTGVGLAIVFAVLVILMLVMIAMKKVFYKEPESTAKPQTEQTVQEVKKTTAETADDDELIAVLTAAVAASLNTSTYNLRIKSYRRVGGFASAWNRAGVDEAINSRL